MGLFPKRKKSKRRERESESFDIAPRSTGRNAPFDALESPSGREAWVGGGGSFAGAGASGSLDLSDTCSDSNDSSSCDGGSGGTD